MGDENEISSLNYKYKIHLATKFDFRRLNLKKGLYWATKIQFRRQSVNSSDIRRRKLSFVAEL
jgi:hypothetical protein